jgi:amino acid transporter
MKMKSQVTTLDAWYRTSISHLMLTYFSLRSFGIVIVIGGQYVGWNVGLDAGFGSFLIATVLMGAAFLCLVLCLCEISSALPFPGLYYFPGGTSI